MFVWRVNGIWIVVLTLRKESFGTLKDLFTIWFIKSVMILAIFLFKDLFILGWDVLHIFFIKKGNFFNESTDDVPYISDPSMFFDPCQQFKHIIKKKAFFNHIFGKDILSYMFHVWNQTIFVNLRNVSCLFEHLQRF